VKNLIYKTVSLVVLLLILVFLLGFSGCKKDSAVETQDIEQSDAAIEEDLPPETTTDEEPAEDIVIHGEDSDEEIKQELFIILNNFLQAVKENKEYAFFDSYTVDVVGSEEEYKNGTSSDIFYIIKESHSSWKNISVESVVSDGNRALLKVKGDRTVEGMEYKGEQIRFKFINENEIWKIDFYYPPDILITAVNPEPDGIINSGEIINLTISADIKSFFAISDISLQLNDIKLNPEISKKDQCESAASFEIPVGSLIKGSNKASCSAVNAAGDNSNYS